jgi:thermitase
VLVKFRPSVDRMARQRLLTHLDVGLVGELAELNVHVLAVPLGSEEAVAAALNRHPAVQYAELDFVARATWVPDDPELDQQWALSVLEAPSAWDVTVGGGEQVIAIVDSGIDSDHPDLASKVWVNADEVPANGLDDDASGCVDDVLGCHFYMRWDSTQGRWVPTRDANVRDDYGHGSHAAGVAGAATNNGVGISGLSWGARLMAVRVLDEYGMGFYSDVAAGIAYAAAQGATVINLSLGGEASSAALQDAVDSAHDLGAILVAAAGNDGGPVLYPAACDNVLAVAATDPSDLRWNRSNRGPQVDMAAPGVSVYSANIGPREYLFRDGTSVSTPHVSGLAALVLALQPWLEPAEVGVLLQQSADDVNALTDPGWDEDLGWGRINAQRAVEAAAMDLSLSLSTEPDWLPSSGGEAEIRARLSDDEGHLVGGGAVVTFSADRGTITPDVALTVRGVATTTLDLQGGVPGSSVAITASFANLSQTLFVPLAASTVTPSATATVTVTPSPTVHPTDIPTPTATATPTATVVESRRYLPLLLL